MYPLLALLLILEKDDIEVCQDMREPEWGKGDLGHYIQFKGN